MTVAQETNKIVYDCDDVTTEFSFSFKIFEKGDLKVTITDSEDNETILTLTTDYTVSGNLEDGGKITTIATWATGNTLTIELDMDLEQPTNLIYGGNYSSEAVETMVDRTVKMIQQLKITIDEVEGGGGGGSISDEAFSGTWNGVSNVGASKNALWDKLEAYGSAADRNAEDIMSDGFNLPDGHAIKVYGDAHWLSGINPYGSPVQYDYARFSDASHIEGRSYTEVRADLNIADGATKYPDTGEQAFLDADHTKLDGIESGATTDQTANEILALLKTVDGTGSELDADLVDGSNPGSAFTRDAEDTLTNGANLPDGAAIKAYGDAQWGGNYTNLTQFVGQTAWRLFYSDNLGDVTELALGTSGQYLKANGISAIPTWDTPSGAGDVVAPATHAADYVPQWSGTPNNKTLVEGFSITAAGKALLDDANAAAQRTTLGLGTAAVRAAEDTMTDGANLPDGHAIKTYGDAQWGGNYTNLTSFVDQTAWRLFYSDNLGDVTELAFGASGQYLKANGAAAAPTWDTPSGAGDVVGPASATDNAISLFDGTTGKLIQNSLITVDAAGAPTFPNDTALRWKQAGGAVKNVLAYDSVDNIIIGVDGDDAKVYIERLDTSSAGAPLQSSRRFSIVANYWKTAAEHQRMATIYHDMQSDAPKSTMHFDMGEDGAEVEMFALENDNGTRLAIVKNLIKIEGGSPGANKVLTSDASGLASWATPSGSSKWTDGGTYIYGTAEAGNTRLHDSGQLEIGATGGTSAPLISANKWGFSSDVTEGARRLLILDGTEDHTITPATWVEKLYDSNSDPTGDNSIPVCLYAAHKHSGSGVGYTHTIMSYALNSGTGDNDVIAVSGRARKIGAGVGDACGVWGSAYNDVNQNGGVMGLESSIYQNAAGMVAGDRLGSKWSTSLHVMGSSTGSPAKAGIAVDATNTYRFWNAMIIDKDCFAGAGAAGTVGINMGSFDAERYPQYALKLGKAGTHFYCNSGDLKFYDPVLGATKTLTQLAAGGGQWTDAGQYVYPNAGSNYRILDAGTNLNTVSFDSNMVYVLAPGVTYDINSNINLAGSYTTLIGYGATIRKTAACMVCIGGNHCKFIGFTVDGNSQNSVNVYVTGAYNEINGITTHHSANDCGICLTNSTAQFNVITNCVSYNNYKMGIASWLAKYNTISNNIAYNNSQDGFTCDGTPTYPAYGNVYVGNQSYNNASGFGIDSAHHCTFTANHVFSSTTYGGMTLWGIEGSSSYLTFSGNTLNNNAGYGICLGPGTSCGGVGSYASSHIKLVGNTYQSNSSGDYYTAGASNVEIIETSGGGGGLNNVVEDTTPQLGGGLDCNGHFIYLDNNDPLYGKNTGGSYKQIARLGNDNVFHIGVGSLGVAIGESSSYSNAIKIHVGGSDRWIMRSVDTDSQGNHYLVVT